MTYPQPLPPPQPAKPKRFGIVALAVAGIVGLFTGGMVGAFSATGTEVVATPAPTVTVTAPAPEPEEPAAEPEEEPTTEEPEPAVYKPRKSDWKVNLKVTGKECFGSAGCNVDLRVEPEFIGDSSTLPTTGTIEVTYKVVGAEDTLVDTFTVEDKQISWQREQSVQTATKGTKLSTKITDVGYTTY